MSEENKRKLKGMAIAGGTLSFVGSTFVSCVSHEGLTLNPLRWIIGIFRYGFPFGYFLLFFLAFLCFIVYMDVKMAGELEKDQRNFFYTKSGTYGTAKLLRTAESIKGVAKIQPPAYACGTILGQMDLTGKRIINQDIFDKSNHRNKHVAIFGASSSGKTFSYVKPFCIQAVRRRESLVITDPKGELYADTVQYFKDSGYHVRRFDLKNLDLSDGWNILGEIREDPDRADILAKIIWSNISDGSSGGIFESGPVSLLKAILLRVALDDKMKERGIQNIGEAYNMLQNPEGEDFLNEQFNPENLDEKTQACIGPYMSYKQGSPNMRGNILITLSSLLNVFQSKLVRKVTSTDDIDLTLPGREPSVYYCILPDMHSTYNFIGAVFFSFLFLDLVDYADNSPGRRCKVPVNFLLDEFANIGSIPEFDKKLATIRSRALNVSIVLQDLPQLMGRYPETYKSILSNCATYINIGCNDADTATFFSDRAGEATIQVRTDQHEKVEPALNMGNKHSTGEGKRKIFTNDELETFGMDECLIVWQAMYTMRAYKYPYTNHPEAKRMVTVDILDYPSIMDEEGRKKVREEEEARVKAYNEKLATGWNPLEYFGGTMVDVSDEEYKASQHIYWYEQVYMFLVTNIHRGKVMFKKLRKRYEKEKQEVRDKVINPNYVDPSVIIDEEPDEDFVVLTSDVEDWKYVINQSAEEETESWSFAEDPSPDSAEQTFQAQEDLEADEEEGNIPTFAEDVTAHEDAAVDEEAESYTVNAAEEDYDEDEEMMSYTTPDDMEEDSPDEPEDTEADVSVTEDKQHSFTTDEENDANDSSSDLFPDQEESCQKESVQKESSKIFPDEETAAQAPAKTSNSRSRSRGKKGKTKEKFEFDWDLLGDQAQYQLQQVEVSVSCGNTDIDRAIRRTLSAFEHPNSQQEAQPRNQPKAENSKPEQKNPFSKDASHSDFMQMLVADQSGRKEQASNRRAKGR